jgi:hypothetical protein
MQKEPLSTDFHLDLDLEQLIPEAAWEEHLLQRIVRSSLPEVIAPRDGRSFAVYTNYDDRGWFALDLHEEMGYVSDPMHTGDYTGLCCVVVTSPRGVTVYWIVETNVGWGAHLTSHARPDPEPRR